MFTGDEYRDGLPMIEKVLKKAGIKGGFFVTGKFLEDKKSSKILKRMIADGHYVGPHSDQHLLYSPWENRDSLLITKDVFTLDLISNVEKIKKLGAQDGSLFIPPYEWYNKKIVDWSNELGYKVYNFTPGIRTPADYTYPEMGTRYMDSQRIINQLYDFELKNSLNGAIILIHLGTDSRRTDKLYNRLDEIINELKNKGYKFVGIDKI